MRRLSPTATVVALGILCQCVFADETTNSEQRKFFEAKIRPVLVQHCYECHSTDADELGGNLRVDDRDSIRSGGESGPALIPGRADESLIIQALRYDGLEMPPSEPLPATVINDFEKWIKMGAPDPREPIVHSTKNLTQHREQDPQSLWSFQPRRRPVVPPVAETDWPRDPIDHFVLARAEQAGLQPTSDASPRTLIRRLYFDLIGLAPSRGEEESFINDCNKDRRLATATLVDRLLASPQFGIRWGRHWLDVARYGESNGDDGLGRNATFPNAWRYRDYVIDAFNSDVPYDRFLTEQIAGDLLPAKSAEQRNRQLTATGFLAIGSKPAAAMNSNFAMDVVDDQINAVCTTVMGLSVACARCHDHKHDPIPTRDYYALAGIFRSTETLYGASANEKLTAPPTPLHELRSSLNEIQQRPDRSVAPELPDRYSEYVAQLKPSHCETLLEPPTILKATTNTEYSPKEFAAVKEARLTGTFDGNVDSYSVSFWFRSSIKNNERPITAYLFSRAKLDDKSLPGDHLGIGGTHDKDRTGKLFVFNGNNSKKKTIGGSTPLAPGSWNHVVLVREGGRVKVFLNGRLEIDDELDATFGDSNEFCVAMRSDKFAPLVGNIGEVALFDRALSDEAAFGIHDASGQPRGIRTPPPLGFAMGVREKAKPEDCKVHINGDGKKLGPVVPRGFLTAYQTVSAVESPTDSVKINPKTSGRAALAQWLTRADHPQTARVMVNRIWLHLFGRAIVTTPDDFGVYGARPTHPDLLDHLADRLVQENWSVKQLIRIIVLTRTYGLDSRCDEPTLQKDPNNIWLCRHSRRRLDAESLRDRMLQASGSIDYSPGTGSAIEGVDMLINWPPGEATDLHRPSNRRSVYLCFLRHAPPRELAAFDLPDGITVAGKREVTSLPTQSLFLLNSEFVIRQSQHIARRVLAEPSLSESHRVRAVFDAVLRRAPDAQEEQRALELVRWTMRELPRSTDDKDDRRLHAWASLGQALLSTNEFRYID